MNDKEIQELKERLHKETEEYYRIKSEQLEREFIIKRTISEMERKIKKVERLKRLESPTIYQRMTLVYLIKLIQDHPNFFLQPQGKTSYAHKLREVYRFSTSRGVVKKALTLGVKLGIFEECDPAPPYKWNTPTCYRMKK